MDKEEYIDLLRTFHNMLKANEGIYSMSGLTQSYKVCNEDVHTYASEYGDDVEVRRLYNKISDILEARIVQQVNEMQLDKELAKMMLRSFHKWDSKEKDVEREEYVVMPVVKLDGKALRYLVGENAKS